jgi:hypothetical protein
MLSGTFPDDGKCFLFAFLPRLLDEKILRRSGPVNQTVFPFPGAGIADKARNLPDLLAAGGCHDDVISPVNRISVGAGVEMINFSEFLKPYADDGGHSIKAFLGSSQA